MEVGEERDSADRLASTTSLHERIRRHLVGSIETKSRVLAECTEEILGAARLCTEALEEGHKVLLCGNGGSAADSQHIAAELVSVLNQDFPRPALAAIALTTDSSCLTAQANDFGYERIFERQVEALGSSGDILVAISTSGNSENVVRAAECAKTRGLSVIGLTGGTGGRVAEVADVTIRVPSHNVQHIQESHITVGHILCDVIEQSLFGAFSKGGKE
ncbi:MAG: SIS domain-containing protein [Candidatus Dadabacteria bacterium]|nr:MAG: SIS domain-containing protein [Candidatus Dadabacteria bacterium]